MSDNYMLREVGFLYNRIDFTNFQKKFDSVSIFYIFLLLIRDMIIMINYVS